MEFMDFPSAVEEIVAIQKKCEMLRKDAAEIAQRTDRVSTFLCALIRHVPEKKPTHNQNIVSDKEPEHDGSWKDILISDLKKNGKSYTSEILERVSALKNVTNEDEKRKMLNTIRTALARFRIDGLVKTSEMDGQKVVWEVVS
jgi:hypothetical protein